MTLSPIKKVQNVSLIKKKKALGENKVTASGNLLTEKNSRLRCLVKGRIRLGVEPFHHQRHQLTWFLQDGEDWAHASRNGPVSLRKEMRLPPNEVLTLAGKDSIQAPKT